MSAQLELDLRPRTWGGKRDHAGRKRSTSDASHATRPKVTRHQPQHVVLRVRRSVGRLRRRAIYDAIRRAMRRSLARADYRIVHVSIQHNHLHFLVEADDRDALTLGMQGLAIAIARAINRSCERRGKVFEFRYHATRIASPRQARNALAYVLNNWRRHGEDNGAALVDRYSSGTSFDGWAGVG